MDNKKYVYTKCIDCGKSISHYSTRCGKCNGKNKTIYKEEKIRSDGTISFDKDYLSKKAWRERNKDKYLKYSRRWSINNRQKRKAQWLASKIPLKDNCEKCGIDGSIEKLERHHPDYSKPLYFMTLCKCCHMGEHRGRRRN